jgi:hypothetical protein
MNNKPETTAWRCQVDKNTIRVEHNKDLIELVAGFIEKGIIFNVEKDAQCYWVISFTGGY